MAKAGKWLELCRQACSEKEPRRMIELAPQAVELWDKEQKPLKKNRARPRMQKILLLKTLTGTERCFCGF